MWFRVHHRLLLRERKSCLRKNTFLCHFNSNKSSLVRRGDSPLILSSVLRSLLVKSALHLPFTSRDINGKDTHIQERSLQRLQGRQLHYSYNKTQEDEKEPSKVQRTRSRPKIKGEIQWLQLPRLPWNHGWWLFWLISLGDALSRHLEESFFARIPDFEAIIEASQRRRDHKKAQETSFAKLPSQEKVETQGN